MLGLGHATLTGRRWGRPRGLDRARDGRRRGHRRRGTVESPALLRVGAKGGSPSARSTASDPLTLSDVYFRVGGPHVGKARVSLEVDSDHVLIDHTWVWRADHGVEGFTAGTQGDTDRWRTNTGRNGLVVNGDDVTATGLFVEHFQQHNTVWNGERGRVVLYQNELPYDPPTQADWTRPDGTLGYAGYKVGDDVTTHSLWGGGSYVFNRNDPSIVTEHGFEVPRTAGVRLHHLLTVNLGAGTIRHVVNDVGAPGRHRRDRDAGVRRRLPLTGPARAEAVSSSGRAPAWRRCARRARRSPARRGRLVVPGVRCRRRDAGAHGASARTTAIGGAARAALTPAAIECQTCSGPSSSRKPERVSTSRTLPKTRTR